MTPIPFSKQSRHGSDSWDTVWTSVLNTDRDRFVMRGPERDWIERIGSEVAATALGAPSADTPEVQKLIAKMAPVMPYLPFDRFGFVLAATVALAGRGDAPARIGPSLERLGAELTVWNRKTAEASFAAAERDTQRRVDEARANAPVDEVTQQYRALVMALASLTNGDNGWRLHDLEGDEGRHLQIIAARLAEPVDQVEELNRELDVALRQLRAAQREKTELAGEVLRLKAQLSARRCPEPVLLRSWQDAEHHAAAWMRYLGYTDAAVTPPGPDGGLDVVAERAIAQVKAEGHLTGAQVVRQLAGLTVGGTHRRKDIVFFSTFGYSRDAVATAEEIGVALFRFADRGEAVPESSAAKRLLEAAAGPVSSS